MTDSHAKAVEAAVRSWNREDGTQIHAMSVAITAYLAAMRAEGWVMVRVEDTAAHVELERLKTQERILGDPRRGAFCAVSAMLKGAGDGQG